MILRGSLPATLSTAILLLSKARSYGQIFSISVMDVPEAESPVLVGPALVHSSILTSCGLPHPKGDDSFVLMPGPSQDKILLLADDAPPFFLGRWVVNKPNYLKTKRFRKARGKRSS